MARGPLIRSHYILLYRNLLRGFDVALPTTAAKTGMRTMAREQFRRYRHTREPATAERLLARGHAVLCALMRSC